MKAQIVFGWVTDIEPRRIWDHTLMAADSYNQLMRYYRSVRGSQGLQSVATCPELYQVHTSEYAEALYRLA